MPSTNSQHLTSCTRCGGRFPGPGVEREGQPYCCDKCARRPSVSMRMMPFLVAAVGALAGAAASTMWGLGRR